MRAFYAGRKIKRRKGMKKAISESDLEDFVISVMDSLGYEVIRNDREEYFPAGLFALRNDYKEVVLVERLRNSLRRINPSATSESIEQAIKQVLIRESQSLLFENERFHKILVDGVDVAVRKNNEEDTRKSGFLILRMLIIMNFWQPISLQL